jgi:hypothetical protein
MIIEGTLRAGRRRLVFRRASAGGLRTAHLQELQAEQHDPDCGKCGPAEPHVEQLLWTQEAQWLS